MKCLNENYITELLECTRKRQPDFNNLLRVLKKEKPTRHTLFEFFMNDSIYMKLSGYDKRPQTDKEYIIMQLKAFRAAGYDYYNLQGSNFNFNSRASNHGKLSRSMSDDAIISDWESFEAYKWNEPEDFDYSRLDYLKEYLPDGMKLTVFSPSGVLENTISLLGYEGMCYLMVDEPELVSATFENVGSRLLKYYKLILEYDTVGACIVNDDWGFNTQTMLSADDMRKYVIPWHKKIVKAIHDAGKPTIMHSCGNLSTVYDDIIDDIKFDGKHSFEDKIEPVEEAYGSLNPRIAVMGGIDVDYVCRKTPQEIYARSCRMLELTKDHGGYALGTGNSVPHYVPYENYMAMIAAALLN